MPFSGQEDLKETLASGASPALTMPLQATVIQSRLNNVTACFSITLKTLELLSDNLNTPFLVPISGTTRSLLGWVQTVKQHKNDCAQLMEQTHELLNAIIIAHIKSDTGGELSPTLLRHVGKFTETLRKIHTFVEAQQDGSIIKKFFRQGEMNKLLNDCRTGLQQGLDYFKIETVSIFTDITEMQKEAEKRHQEALNLIESLSDAASSDMVSSAWNLAIYLNQVLLGSYTSSISISMLPAEPKIFHGRESELVEILALFCQEAPRIAILGAVEPMIATPETHNSAYHEVRFHRSLQFGISALGLVVDSGDKGS
ncbi:hypothetical protein B0H19DRAFT_1068111 [Mycena capillaripes]|nr:hypothetical protein B0H19DRAFT_1068111 [Mycena capillaripes]